ncbi:hypothetical protein LJB90_03565 [Eubacteriales bacterium OttesenSCG-928-G02]|nr:hypothetical protein [Eubacteriales bacterium OttesenSCG-928-G02]
MTKKPNVLCPICKSENELVVKNGFVGKNQRYKCKKCAHQFTPYAKHRQFDEATKLIALFLYHSQFDLSDIAKLFNAKKSSIIQWNDNIVNIIEKCNSATKKRSRISRSLRINEKGCANQNNYVINIKINNNGVLESIECFRENSYYEDE